MDKKRIGLLVAVALLILVGFLSLSRAPALEEKALMGTRTNVAGLAFSQLVELDKTDVPWQRVAKNAINWSYTNWQGMTFGIVFGATLLTLLKSLPLWIFSSNRFIAALQGMLSGAPLGVCVNCATPVAKGIHSAGVRAETYLALMMSSPTLNFIVITMMVALIQPHLVVIKLVATLLFILLFLPVLVRISGVSSLAQDSAGFSDWAVPVVSTSWMATFRDTARDWLVCLAFVARITVPLMILAGLLGAILIEFVSLKQLSSLAPDYRNYVAVALLGTLLPAPIAFDVVLTAALLSAGFPVGLAMTLFFSLGIFSLFPAMVLAREVSVRLSLVLVLGVTVFASVVGVLTEQIHNRMVVIEEERLDESLEKLAHTSVVSTLKSQLSTASTLCQAELSEDPLCMEELIRRETFGIATESLCEGMYALDLPSARLCREVVKERLITRRAIEQKNISLCERYECRQHYLDSFAHLPETLGMCDSVMPDPARCRFSLIQRRILYFRNENACSLSIGVEKALCRNELQLVRATDQMSLQACDKLPRHLREDCTIRVISNHLAEDGAFECDGLAPEKMAACGAAKRQYVATTATDPAACPSEPLPLASLCKLQAIGRTVKAMSVDQSSPSIAMTSELADEPLVLEAVSLPAPIDLQRRGTGRRIKLQSAELKARGKAEGRYIRHEPEASGLVHSWSMRGADLFEPFSYGKGLAAGDINGDGYPDLVVAFEKGVYLYSNLGDGQFAVTGELRPDADFNTFLVALLDYDNDGSLDLFATAYGGKRVIYLNRNGQFTERVEVPRGLSPLTMSSGFADLDQDGDLDMVLGNWSFGVERNFNPGLAANEMLMNQGASLVPVDTFRGEPSGQSLSVLLTDMNEDGLVDIIVGNDRRVPDMFYEGTGDSGYRLVEAGAAVTESSLNTMSYESADFNNDLQLDLFSTDMLFESAGRDDYCIEMKDSEAVEKCKLLARMEAIIVQGRADYCHALPALVPDCVLSVVIELAIRERRPDLCARIPEQFSTRKRYCDLMTGPLPMAPEVELSLYPSQLTSNRMHWRQEGGYLDVTETAGVARSNWAWNARALDVDSDGDLDIYIGNGTGMGALEKSTFLPDVQMHSNVLYRNEGDGSFESAAVTLGLEDFSNTASFVQLDADLDGDPDLVTYGQLTGLRYYENRVNDANNVTISLRDSMGNSHCIGCTVIIRTTSGEQLREIKLSGGFLSYDEPQVHFGLGQDEVMTEIRIRWSTGEQSRLHQDFPANHHYRVTRSAPGS